MHPEEDPCYGYSISDLLPLAKRLREAGNPRLANSTLQRLLRLLRSEESLPEIPVHDLDAELSSVCYYEPSLRQHGLRATERLLFDLTCVPDLKRLAVQNSFFYLQPFPYEEKLELRFDLPIVPGTSFRFRASNPAIVRVRDGYRVICRAVNYISDRAFWYESLGHDRIIRTRNFFLALSRELKVVRAQEIVDHTARRTYPTGIEGFEDCRLFLRERNGATEYWFTCTVSDTQPVWLCRIGLAQIHFVQDQVGDLAVTKLTLLEGPNRNRFEKNWLPFEHYGHLNVIYSFDPVTILGFDPGAGACSFVRQSAREYDCSRFRGGAPPVPFDEGYLAIVHEVVTQGYRRYLHRFVWLDSDFALKKATTPFYFIRPTIEFCAGLCHAHEEDDVLVTMGLDDSQAFLFRVDKNTIRSRLVPCPSSDLDHVLGALGDS